MVKNLDVFLQHPWGRDCFEITMKSIKLRKQEGICKSSMAIQGFVHGLQLVALCVVPKILSFAVFDINKLKTKALINAESDEDDDGGKLVKAIKINMNALITLETERKTNVPYTLSAEGIQGDDLSCSGDVVDPKVLYMIELLEKNHTFTVESLPGGVDVAALLLKLEEGAKLEKGKSKRDDAVVPIRKKVKINVQIVNNSMGKASGSTSHSSGDIVSDAQYQKILDNLQDFKLQFTSLLDQQKLAYSKDFNDMSDKMKAIADQVAFLQSQQKAPNVSKKLTTLTISKLFAKADDRVFISLLLAVGNNRRSAFKVSKDVSVSRSSFVELWEQTQPSLPNVMDNIKFFVRDRFLEEFKLIPEVRQTDFFETEFALAVSKIHLYLKRWDYKVPKKVSKYFGVNRQWFTDFETIYCPYNIDEHWVGLCIDLSDHEIIVLQPDPTKFGEAKLNEVLRPFAEALPGVITKAVTNTEMQAVSRTPFTVKSYGGNWKIESKGSHGIATILLIKLHATAQLTSTYNLQQSCIIEAGKIYAIQLYEKFTRPLHLS